MAHRLHAANEVRSFDIRSKPSCPSSLLFCVLSHEDWQSGRFIVAISLTRQQGFTTFEPHLKKIPAIGRRWVVRQRKKFNFSAR
jgi:hypothetical protein